jgi:hypothetical protein
MAVSAAASASGIAESSETRRARCCPASPWKRRVRHSSKKPAASSPTLKGGTYIVDLRPGVYQVTFTLSGFNVFARDGIELTSG